MDTPDEQILRRVQAGDHEAYLLLFDRYYARVEAYARKQLHNSEMARDMASETFLRAYRSIHDFRTGEISYLAYLFMICRRLIITELARSRNARTFSWSEAVACEDRLIDREELPLERTLRQEQREAIQTAINSLRPNDREIILLAFERHLSRSDIAVILNKPSVSAVTSHLHRAMQNLKTIVTEQGYFAASVC